MSMDEIYKSSAAVGPKSNGGFAGYGSTFHTLDLHGDIVAPGAYLDDIPRFLQKGFVGGSNHDHKNPIGKYIDAHEDSIGLYVEAVLTSSKSAQDTRLLINDQVIQGLSIGLLPLQTRKMSPSDVTNYWDKAGYVPSEQEIALSKSGARLIKRAKILEISPAALPVNENATIVSYKSREPVLKAGKRLSKASKTSLKSVLDKVKESLSELEEFLDDSEESESMSEEVTSEAFANEILPGDEAKLASFAKYMETL